MRIFLNGDEKLLDGPTTIAALLEQLGLAGSRVAVEVNAQIVPRGRHDEQWLNQDDRVEIVRAIGGG